MDEAEVVQGQVDAYNARDLDRFLSYYSADAIIEDGTGAVMVREHDGMRSMYDALFSQSPDLHVDVPHRIHTSMRKVCRANVVGRCVGRRQI